MIQTWPVRIMVRSASQNSARSAVETLSSKISSHSSLTTNTYTMAFGSCTRPSAFGSSLQHVDELGDDDSAAAIDQRMLEVEGLEPAERRAFPLRLRGIDHLGGLEPLADPVPHVDFEQLLELDRLFEVVEGRLESAVGVAEPLVDELAHRIELGHLLRALLTVLH